MSDLPNEVCPVCDLQLQSTSIRPLITTLAHIRREHYQTWRLLRNERRAVGESGSMKP